jgi:hypothetical protein
VITDYATLQASIGQWLARSDMAASAPDLIQLAEVRIGRDLQRMQHRRLMVTATGTLTAGAAALPSDFATIRSVEVPYGTGNIVLPPYDSTMQEAVVSTPSGYWIDGNTLRVVGGGESAYTLNYWQRLPSIAVATNWLIGEAPDLYLYATLLEAAPYMKNDSRIPVWQAGYTAAIAAIEDENSRARSGYGKRARPSFHAP